MKRILALTLGLCLLFSLSSCAGTELTDEKLGGIHTSSGDLYPDQFLTFDGQAVSFDEFRYFYLNYKNMYLEKDKDYFKDGQNEEALKKEVLQCLLDRWAVQFLAKKEGVRLSSREKKDILSEIKTTESGYQSRQAFLEELHTSYLSLSFYQDMLEYSALYLKLFDKLYKDDGKRAFSNEEFYAYFNENYLAVQEIYLPFETGEDAENCPKTTAAAESILKEAESSDFWTLVEKYGKDENMLDYPDGYYITEGQAEDALYQALKALEIGKISQPVVGQTGVYILKRMELKELRMEENRQTALFGYRDSEDVWHNGAYDNDFYELYRKKAAEIKVEYPTFWEEISTATVY